MALAGEAQLVGALSRNQKAGLGGHVPRSFLGLGVYERQTTNVSLSPFLSF